MTLILTVNPTLTLIPTRLLLIIRMMTKNTMTGINKFFYNQYFCLIRVNVNNCFSSILNITFYIMVTPHYSPKLETMQPCRCLVYFSIHLMAQKPRFWQSLALLEYFNTKQSKNTLACNVFLDIHRVRPKYGFGTQFTCTQVHFSVKKLKTP